MKPQPPFVWEQLEAGLWTLSLPRGVHGEATVIRDGDTTKPFWVWSIVGFEDRANANGQAPLREEAMVAAQQAILTKSGRFAPRPARWT